MRAGSGSGRRSWDGVGRASGSKHNLDSEVELSCLRTHGQSSLQRGVHCRGVFLGATMAASRAIGPANWVAVSVYLSALGIEHGGWDEVWLSSLFLLVQAC